MELLEMIADRVAEDQECRELEADVELQAQVDKLLGWYGGLELLKGNR